MKAYRVMPGVPGELVAYVSKLLAAERRARGTRRGTRVLTCRRQAVYALAWFRDKPDIPRLGRGFGLSQATAYRYLDEAIEVLAGQAPGLHEALVGAKEEGLTHLILDGKVVGTDRVKIKTISRKGKTIDLWFSGKTHGFGGNIQAIFAPAGIPLWVSDVLPGTVHDLAAARDQVLHILRPHTKDLPVFAAKPLLTQRHLRRRQARSEGGSPGPPFRLSARRLACRSGGGSPGAGAGFEGAARYVHAGVAVSRTWRSPSGPPC